MVCSHINLLRFVGYMLELLTSPLELATYKEAIMEEMFKGTKRYIESEETETKNVQVD